MRARSIDLEAFLRLISEAFHVQDAWCFGLLVTIYVDKGADLSKNAQNFHKATKGYLKNLGCLRASLRTALLKPTADLAAMSSHWAS